MRKLLLLAISLVLFTSCELKEEITFNKDGSGDYQMVVDMSGFMSMAKDMDKENDTLKQDKEPMIMDTIYRMADILEEQKDSIAQLSKEEREVFESMKDMYIKMHADETKGEMTLSYVFPFKKITDLDDIMGKFETIEKNREGGNKDVMGGMSGDMPKTKVQYKFTKRKFQRKVQVIEEEDEEIEEIVQQTDEDQNDEQTEQLDAMLSMLTYKLVYHFPYEIKSVSYKDAMLSADKKTLIIEVPMSALKEDPKLLDFEVKFK